MLRPSGPLSALLSKENALKPIKLYQSCTFRLLVKSRQIPLSYKLHTDEWIVFNNSPRNYISMIERVGKFIKE